MPAIVPTWRRSGRSGTTALPGPAAAYPSVQIGVDRDTAQALREAEGVLRALHAAHEGLVTDRARFAALAAEEAALRRRSRTRPCPRKRDRARRRDWRFYAVLGLVLALAAATLLPMAWSIRYQLRYREFVEVLSESTLDSYRTGSFTAERDGETVPLSGGCGYQIYTLAAGLTPGRWRQPPEESAPITIHYRDGASLAFWEVPLRNQKSATGLFFWYTDPEGKGMGFDSPLLHLSGVERLLDQDAETERNGEHGNG